MLNKPYRTIHKETGTLKIYGNNHLIQLHSSIPEWNKDKEMEDKEEDAFFYKGNEYFLSEFVTILSDDLKKLGFDGIHNDSFFSGVLIKLTDDSDYIKAYTYIC